jgi:pantetheine-phosphate adenylyltransferase
MRTAVFPGSFDPITKGHESVIRRASVMFDKLIVAVGVNSAKQYFFDLEERLHWVKTVTAEMPNVEVEMYQILTVEFCRLKNARYLIRGLRNITDFEYERNIAHMNHILNQEIETVFLLTEPEYAAINANIVREIYRNGGDIRTFIPESTHHLLK